MSSVGAATVHNGPRASWQHCVAIVLRLAVASVLALICAFWPAGKPTIAAGTCSCLAPDSASALSAADVAFIGKLSSFTVNPIVKGANEPATYTFSVESVFKGSAPSTAVVFSFADPGSCGLVSMETGIRYVIFANLVRSDGFHPAGAPDGTMMSTVCNGNILLDAAAPAPPFLGTAAPPVTAAPGRSLPTVALDIPSAPDTTWKRSLAIVAGAVIGIGLIARILAGRRSQVVR